MVHIFGSFRKVCGIEKLSPNLLVSKTKFDRWWWVWCPGHNQNMHVKCWSSLIIWFCVYCIPLAKNNKQLVVVDGFYLFEFIIPPFCSQDSTSTMLAPTAQKLGKLTRGNESRDFWRILSGGPETWLKQIPLIVLRYNIYWHLRLM